MRGNRTRLVGVALGMLLLHGAAAVAADQLILGRRLVIKPGVTRMVADEPNSPNTVVGDPRIGGATLTVFANGGTSTSQTIPLPAAYWTQPFQNGFGFSPRGQAGPVRFVRLRKSFAGKFFLKVLLRGAIAPLNIVPPNPGDNAGMILAINGGDRYCTGFAGAAGGAEPVDDADLWRVLRADAEVPCGSPSGAFLE
jgi:hypothetical protein